MNFKHPEKLGVITSFNRFNGRGDAAAVRTMTGIMGKNPLTAERSLNSLLNSFPAFPPFNREKPLGMRLVPLSPVSPHLGNKGTGPAY